MSSKNSGTPSAGQTADKQTKNYKLLGKSNANQSIGGSIPSDGHQLAAAAVRKRPNQFHLAESPCCLSRHYFKRNAADLN
jgi:hypothetical protein